MEGRLQYDDHPGHQFLEKTLQQRRTDRCSASFCSEGNCMYCGSRCCTTKQQNSRNTILTDERLAPRRLATVLSSAEVASRYNAIAKCFSRRMALRMFVSCLSMDLHPLTIYWNVHRLSRKFFLNTLSGKWGSISSYPDCTHRCDNTCRMITGRKPNSRGHELTALHFSILSFRFKYLIVLCTEHFHLLVLQRC